MKLIDLLVKMEKKEIEDGTTFFVKYGEDSDVTSYINWEIKNNDFVEVDMEDPYDYLASSVYHLHDEIEIIEEKPKKIEHITYDEFGEKLPERINQLIDTVNYLLEKESDK